MMSEQYPMQAYAVQQMTQQQELSMLLHAARTGAMVGATGAAAVNLHRMRRNETDWRQALSNTAKVGLTAGVATAAAAAVSQLFARHRTLSVVAGLATGTAVMYALSNDKKAGKAEASDD